MLTEGMTWAIIIVLGLLVLAFAIKIAIKGGKAKAKSGNWEAEVETHQPPSENTPKEASKSGTATLKAGNVTDSELTNSGASASTEVQDIQGSKVINKAN
jgi:hypothetical protein